MTSKSFVGMLILASTALGTNVHANKGCIDVNDVGLCAPDSVAIESGSARIAARFDSGNKYPTAVPGCILNAAWPSGYGDIYFGADNCLYDSQGQNINGQCCEPGSGGTTAINNPYA